MNKEIEKMLSGISSVKELAKKNKVTFREKIIDWYLYSQAVDCQSTALLWFFIFITASVSNEIGFILGIVVSIVGLMYFDQCIKTRDIMKKEGIGISKARREKREKILTYGMIAILFLAFVRPLVQSL